MLLDNASGRIAEVDVLSRSGDSGRAIATTLEDFVQQASEASDLLLGDYASTGHSSSIEELRSFTADSMGALTDLQDVIPDDARASLIEATEVITAVDVQAQSLCPACTDLPIMEEPVSARKAIDTLIDDALGPLTAPVEPAVASPKNRPGKGTKGEGRTTTPSQPATQPDPSSGPSLPTGPTAPIDQDDTDNDDKNKAGGKNRGGPLGDLEVSGSKDPIGDLLTGADEAVDGIVKGLGCLGKS